MGFLLSGFRGTPARSEPFLLASRTGSGGIDSESLIPRRAQRMIVTHVRPPSASIAARMSAFVSVRQAAAAIVLSMAAASGCNQQEEEDPYARCKKDPNCRGQECVDVRAELYSRGEYKSAGMLNCQNRRGPK